MGEKITLNYPVFDGTRVWEKASVVIEDGMISHETVLGAGNVDSRYFLMPALIDAHTHMGTQEQVSAMLKHGIAATCDVCASPELIATADKLTIHSSIGQKALSSIVEAAHEKGLKVAAHATEVATVRQAVEAGADILLHVPMKETFPEEFARTIAEKGIAAAGRLRRRSI